MSAAAMLVGAAAPVRAAAPGSPGAKAEAKCQQTIAKADAKFLSQRLKRLAACSTAVLSCVQTAPGNAACVNKATAKCRKLGTPDLPDALADAAEAAIVKACGALPVADLLDASGLGFAGAEPACFGVGVDALAGAADVATCLQRLQARASEQTFGVALPRAAELTAQGGVSALVVPDLPPFGGCGECGAAAGKAMAACGVAITKAAAGFLAKARSGLDKCTSAFVACDRQKPGDAACLTKAAATCQKLPPDLDKARAKVSAAMQKKCAGVLGFADVQSPTGINVAALTCECQQVGVSPLATLQDYADCLTRQHECKLAALVPSTAPALPPLLAAQGLEVADLLCPTVATSLAKARAGGGARPFAPLFGSIKKFIGNASPSTFRTVNAPKSTLKAGPRIGRPFRSPCGPGPGRSCLFRFPIRPRPFGLQRGTPAAAPVLILAVRRTDGEFAQDHYEIALDPNDVEKEITIDYPPDLESCDFELALTVVEDGDVAPYTAVEQEQHPIPSNDGCDSPHDITTASFSEILDTTAASAGEEISPSCGTASGTVWYRFVAPASGVLQVDTFGSDYDTAVAVSTGSCGALIERACADDTNGTLQSKVGLVVQPGQTYVVQIARGAPTDAPTTLHVGFQFQAGGGTPPKLVNPSIGFTAINTPSCTFPGGFLGSLFRIGFDFTDPDGDVLPGTTLAHVTTAFEPSGVSNSFDLVPGITGDGFTGRGEIDVCVFYSGETSVEVSVELRDFAGGKGDVSVKIPRPSGAN